MRRSLVRRRMVRAAERQAPVLRTARIRGDGTIVDGEVVDDPWSAPRPVAGVIEGRIADGPAGGPVVEGEIVDGPDANGGRRAS